MQSLGTYPFGAEIKRLEQKDKSPKRFFVIGSYASAVHAEWKSGEGKIITKSLPVQNEPEILWTGHPAETSSIIAHIPISEEVGLLRYPGKWLNGVIGRMFNLEILKPLKLFRADLWFTLLIPYTVANKGQRKAISRYVKYIDKYNLPKPSIQPSNIKGTLITEERINEIREELEASQAEIIITLGDLPLYHFIRIYNPEIVNLSVFNFYGQLNDIKIGERSYKLLPLYHPKAGENIGSYTERWRNYHYDWIKYTARELLLN